MSGFTDLHAHFLYGLDDGARAQKDMEDMLDAAHVEGISFLFATPHVTPGIEPFDEQRYAYRLAEADAYCRWKGYAMRLFQGAEILYTPAIRRYVEERRLPALANTSFVLTEFVPDISFAGLKDAVDLLERSGYTPVLAHIERYDCLRNLNAYRLKEKYDVRYQINCGTLVAGRGFFTQRRIHSWLKDEMIDFVATDAHDCGERPFRMREAYAILTRDYGKEYADLLTGFGGISSMGLIG